MKIARTGTTVVLVALVIGLGGCKSPLQSAQWTQLEGDDLVRITDDMAVKMAGSAAVQDAIRREGKLRIVIEPVENYMTAEVLPAGASHAFLSRLRALLAMHAPDSFTWIMNRDSYYAMRARELEGVDLGPNPESVQPEYALTARFDSITTENAQRRSSYYLCSFFLTNLQTRDVLWTGKYEMKKTAVKGFLD
jgi:hypothetical protein